MKDPMDKYTRQVGLAVIAWAVAWAGVVGFSIWVIIQLIDILRQAVA